MLSTFDTIDKLPAPDNLQCIEASDGLLISWDAVTNHSCAQNFVYIAYDVIVVRISDGKIIGSLNDIEEDRTEIPESMLEPSQNYSINVNAKIVNQICENEAATIVCSTSDTLSSTGMYYNISVCIALGFWGSSYI